ncbi:Triacylglycerol lipase 2 [Glycine soja]
MDDDGITRLLNQPEQELPLILEIMGLTCGLQTPDRGTKYSCRHISLEPSSLAYWNWSWDEIVSYDLLVMFNYVFSQTEQKINYVGHSLGTLIALASFSEGKLVNQLKSTALLSPIAYLSHMNTKLGVVVAKSFVGEITTLFGLVEFNPKELAVDAFLKSLCAHPGIGCYDLLTALTGKNCCLNSSTLDLFLMNESQSTSTNNMAHLAQMGMSPPPLETSQSLKISSKAPQDGFLVKLSSLSVSPQPKTLKKLNNPSKIEISVLNRQSCLGDVSSTSRNLTIFQNLIQSSVRWLPRQAQLSLKHTNNIMHYGEIFPPIYNLSNIPHDLPLFISYGGSDALSDVRDVENLLDKLKFHDEDKHSIQFIEEYAHANYIMGFNASDLIEDDNNNDISLFFHVDFLTIFHILKTIKISVTSFLPLFHFSLYVMS